MNRIKKSQGDGVEPQFDVSMMDLALDCIAELARSGRIDRLVFVNQGAERFGDARISFPHVAFHRVDTGCRQGRPERLSQKYFAVPGACRTAGTMCSRHPFGPAPGRYAFVITGTLTTFAR